jgi:hypothetical protein
MCASLSPASLPGLPVAHVPGGNQGFEARVGLADPAVGGGLKGGGEGPARRRARRLRAGDRPFTRVHARTVQQDRRLHADGR